MTTLLAPQEELAATSPADREHIVCDCRPKMTYCGAFDDTPPKDEDIDGSECPECLEVWSTGCPNCGCKPDEDCAKCEQVDRA